MFYVVILVLGKRFRKDQSRDSSPAPNDKRLSAAKQPLQEMSTSGATNSTAASSTATSSTATTSTATSSTADNTDVTNKRSSGLSGGNFKLYL